MDLNLEVDFDLTNSIQWNCSSKTLIGVMSPGEKKIVNLSIIPILEGQFELPGIVLKDSLLNNYYKYTNYATISVE